ncbi:hypothetical protein FN846DRAFT_253324 [Sphaerosporella brunnea]|uniref:Glycosyl transferase CAP10 domain-containing protein n=1 Tax=Sphaerosporella brunnea TaxID=1250544 RepID=A0A5J5F7F7_9PEZI|nr:hypothetical protein FN846DRAFT_253324 [Sphaerosporella brunnea]
MSTFSFDFSPATTPATGSAGLQPPSTIQIVLSLFVLHITSAKIRYPLYGLLTNAITWVAIYIISRTLPSASTAKRKRKPLLLAGCILAAALCRRVQGIRAGWETALVPLLYVGLRTAVIGGDAKGRWRPGAVVTTAGLVALCGAPVMNSHDLALGTFAAVFTALGYVLLEEISVGGETGWVQLGRETGLYLSIGLTVAAVALENIVGEAVVWQGRGWAEVVMRNSGGPPMVTARVVGVGLLDAARFGLLAVLITRGSTVSGVFVDLSATLALALWAAFIAVKAAAAVFAVAGMMWWSFMGAGVQIRMMHAVVFIAVCGVLSLVYAAHARRVDALGTFDAGSAPIVSTSNHPIPKLIQEAEDRFYTMRKSQSKTLEEAVQEYKRRYRMSPPPNFDQWYYFAKRRGAVIIDEYDTIYHSLKPFWGISPKDIRTRARQSMGYRNHSTTNSLLQAYVRGGEVQIDGQGPLWMKKAIQEMLEGFMEWLPDMDLPFNIHDEPRVVVPFKDLKQHVEKAEEQISHLNLNFVRNNFTPLKTAEKAIPPPYDRTSFDGFAHQSLFPYSTMSCPPDSPVRVVSGNVTDKHSGQLLGFIANSTESSDICLSPSLQNRHGFFDRPNSLNVVKELYPVFSQSKISSYGDILYPSPWYWAHKVSYEESLDPQWEHKVEKLYWRGSTTGGYSKNGGWRRHHRQRVVTVIDANDTAKILQPNDGTNWAVTEVPRETLKELFDVSFSHVGQCDPEDCRQQRNFFHIAQYADQQGAWQWKYLLDMDGNAFSGRYHAFLKSRSVVFKLAVFREWHDEWLYPWVHYIPLSMELEEVAEIMRFFRYEKEGEQYARRIADQGRSWAQMVLRDQDLVVWLFRLLLEYGRVVDDNRDTIGFCL